MEPASSYFEAELVEPRRHLLYKEHDAELELVVRRKADGAEIVRTPAELDVPALLLDNVHQDLRSMTEEEFLAEWKMPDNL